MSLAIRKLRRFASLLLVPLSVTPFVLVVPGIASSHRKYVRLHESGPLPAPAQDPAVAAELSSFAPVAPVDGAVPVLAYHGINSFDDDYSVSRASFAAQMRLLRHLGYEAISIDQYARFRRGEPAGLPPRPVLITFDDGRLDSYRGADEILRREGMRATMFVITGPMQRRNLFYLTWKELHRMSASGRWDVQAHAHDGHSKVAVDASGRTGPFYGVRRWTRSAGRESLADYEARVTSDVFAVRDALEEQGFESHAFAVPYGDYGQRSANDPRIPQLFSSLIERQFGTYFIQDGDNDPSYSRPGSGAAPRYEVHTSTTLRGLDGWLRRHHPAHEEPAR